MIANRRSPMTSKTVAQLLIDLDIEKTHSRPHVSNDNPYSESHFSTLKDHPEFPKRFSCYDEAHEFCKMFFGWYNNEHRHSGIGYLTPAMVHFGRTDEVVAKRQRTMDEMFGKYPERFVRGKPLVPQPPDAVWINKPKNADGDENAP